MTIAPRPIIEIFEPRPMSEAFGPNGDGGKIVGRVAYTAMADPPPSLEQFVVIPNPPRGRSRRQASRPL